LRQELDAARKTPVLAAAERGDELSDIRESIGHARASLAVIQVRIDTIAEQVDFYREHSTCPTCRQTIGDEFIREIRSELMNESARLKSDAAVKQADIDQKSLWLKKHEPEIRDAWVAARERDRKIAAQVERLSRIEDDIERACARAERIGNERNPFDEQLRLARSRREELTKQQRALNRQMLSLKAKAEKANYWKTAFKRVRLFIVRRIMQSLEMEVAAAASALGLPGWRISFATETETKSGSIKHGIQIAVQSPQTTGPWSKWSGGEGQRIKLSVNIGLSNLIQKMAGVDIAFEVWDEPSQHLSVEGVEDLLTCLEYRAQVTGKQIWVVDHTPINYAGFTEVWQATKTTQDGSRLKRIAGV
jgi:DNA repair exonuclease SbcCD ATPase subunit